MRPAIVLLVLMLAACGAAPAKAITATEVVSAFAAAGVPVENVQPGVRPGDSPLPNSFKEYVTFTIPSLGDKGGQVFVCETKQNCDALYSYFDAMKGLGGPYYYQSPSGTVVAQLNSGLAADEAAKFAAAIATFR